MRYKNRLEVHTESIQKIQAIRLLDSVLNRKERQSFASMHPSIKVY
jgi:hypothetical protein